MIEAAHGPAPPLFPRPRPRMTRPPSAPPRRVARLLARALVLGLALALAALLLGAAALLLLLPSQQPLVAGHEELAPRDVERALALARRHDPRRAIPGVVRGLSLTQHEAELLLNLAMARLRPGRWTLAVGAEQLRLRGSLRLPANPLGEWLNVEVELRQAGPLPALDALRLGRLALPSPLLQRLVELALRTEGLDGWRALGAATIQQLRLRPQRLDIVYAWRADAPAQLIAALLPARERARMQVYAQRLTALAAQQASAGAPGMLRGPRVLPLSTVLPPLFELARARSAAGEDPALENRAVLLVLGMAANGLALSPLLPAADAAAAQPPIRLTLAGRGDFPQHYLSSAALAAEVGTPLADLVGLYKELADARTGSGFSFNDIAANRAGTRLGRMAVAAPGLLQERAAASRSDLDLLPDVSDLPEFMSAADFQRRYGTPGSADYERMMREIEARLGHTPLLQPAP